MSQNESSKISYFNTLIFTIVSGIVSLILLLTLVMSPKVKEHAFYFVVAVEIGIFAIIVYCIYQIMFNESKLRYADITSKISFYECPDYFVKTYQGADTLCVNNYQVTDDNDNKFLLRIYPEDQPLPTELPIQTTSKSEKFNLYHIEQTQDFKNAKDECAFILNEPQVNLATSAAKQELLNQFVGYSKLPWMHARSRCGTFASAN